MTPHERASRIQRQVDRLIERGNLRGALQRRRDDPDEDTGQDLRFTGTECDRIVIFNPGGQRHEPGAMRQCEKGDAECGSP